ncbi:hypothetical protein Rhal01_01950 [Rubritalea halochordaticola]|uniref:DUF6268 domain-containing protein n=2 Tax=Rubritalea halochordaticola TaxID=714537 RepID=A0ABP9V3W9_9BACT
MCFHFLTKSFLTVSIMGLPLAAIQAGELMEAPSPEADAMKPIVSKDGPRMLSFYYDYFSEVDFDDESGSYQMHAARLQTPVVGGGGERFSWGVDAFFEYINFDVKDQPLLEDQDLYRTGLDLNFIWHKVNGSKWSPVIRLSPSLASDFESVTNDDFRMTAFVGSFYRQRPNLKWLFGLYYTDNLNDELLLPGFGVSWQPTEKMDVTLLGPRIDVSYRPQEDWRLGLFASAHSRSWNIEGDTGSESFEVNSMRTGVRVDYQMKEGLWLVMETGATMLNAVELLDNDEHEVFDDDAETGFFGKIGMRYRF